MGVCSALKLRWRSTSYLVINCSRSLGCSLQRASCLAKKRLAFISLHIGAHLAVDLHRNSARCTKTVSKILAWKSYLFRRTVMRKLSTVTMGRCLGQHCLTLNEKSRLRLVRNTKYKVSQAW